MNKPKFLSISPSETSAKLKMLQLAPGGRWEKKKNRENFTIMQEKDCRTYVIGKVMTNTVNTDAAILIIHWEMNHRLDSHLSSINQALPSDWRSHDRERRRGRGLEEQRRKLRWDHLHYSSVTFPLQETTCAFTEHLSNQLDTSGGQSHLFYLLVCFYSGRWDVFQQSTSIPLGVNLALFSGQTLNIGLLIAWTCLAQGSWYLLSCLQFSTRRQLTFSPHSQPDWALNPRSWSRGLLSAMNPWGIICSQSHARTLCCWQHRRLGWGRSQRAQVSSNHGCCGRKGIYCMIQDWNWHCVSTVSKTVSEHHLTAV